MALYLGFEASTQGLGAIVLDVDGDTRRVVFSHTLNFDRDFPQYGTTAGIVRAEASGAVQAPPVMWADALDRLMAILARDASVDIGGIRAVSGSAPPHLVYVNRRAREAWRRLAHDQPLAPQLAGTLTRDLSPVGVDGLTAGRLAAEQLRDLHAYQPGVYDATVRIHLASSFLASLLTGTDAPLDPGDASSTALTDLAAAGWDEGALDATAPGLSLKLPEVRPSFTSIGELSAYWQNRYSFPPAQVVAWSGDLTTHLVGTGVVGEGHLAITLGTSDTALSHSRAPRVAASRVLASPMGGFTNVMHFRNGALTRDWIRRSHHLDWDGFAAALERTPPGNHGVAMLPWLEQELTPAVRFAGIRRFGYDGRNPAHDVRAVVEGQMCALANHASALSGDLKRVVATGGSGMHDAVLQVMADVFAAPVDRLTIDYPACLGAALRALHADRLVNGEPLAWHSVVKVFTEPRPIDRIEPRQEHAARYRELRARYAELETLHKDRAPIA